MSFSVPRNYTLTYPAVEIEQQVSRVAAEVTTWCNNCGGERDVLAIPVLRGGLYFCADLTRKIDCSLDLAPGRASAYEDGRNVSTYSELYINLDGVSVAGRSVLLIDDICDSGRTLNKLTHYLLAQGADDVRTAVLIFRERQESEFKPSWTGFTFSGDDWFVGYGMDDRGKNRNRPDIYTIPPQS